MAGKRRAGNELTDKNWDQEEEPEEGGVFKQADESELKNRIIKTAKRRGVSSSPSPSATFSGFSGFKGFSSGNSNLGFGSLFTERKTDESRAKTEDAPANDEPAKGDKVQDAKTEGSERNGADPLRTKSNGEDQKPGDSKTATEEPVDGIRAGKSLTNGEEKSAKESLSAEQRRLDEKDQRYLSHVKKLNESVLKWIQKHVQESPSCILSPVFEDYEKHLRLIEAEFGVVASDAEDSDVEKMTTTKSSKKSSKGAEDESEGETELACNLSGDEHGDQGEGYGDNQGDGHGDDTFSATKTRHTTTKAAQSTAARGGLDASLKEIDSKDHPLNEKGGSDDAPKKLTHYASFSSTKTNHTFSFSNLPHTRAPTSSCNSAMRPTFSFCVSGADTSDTGTYTTASKPGIFSYGGGSKNGTGGASFNFGTTSTSAPPSSTSNFVFSFDAAKSGAASVSGAPVFGKATDTATTTGFTLSKNGGESSSGTSSVFGSGASSGLFGAGSFGSGAASSTGIFGNGGVFSSSSKQVDAETTENGAGDEEYVPPKPEVNVVTEDDAVFTKRCKLFYKKESAFVDRGVGNLFIKRLMAGEGDDGAGDRYSLLIRADTNLGNILLNVSLKGLKFDAIGPKEVKFVCVPNPSPDPKMAADEPVMMLLRLKDEAIRDETLEVLKSKATGDEEA